MGLLSKLSEGAFASSEKTEKADLEKASGLLQKSILLSSKKLNYQYISDLGIDFYAFFEKSDNHYIISNSYGLDSATIFASYSTVDFWNGSIIHKNQWNYFSEKESTISQFYQFFSFDLKDKIKAVAVYFSDDDTIIMLGSSNESFTPLSEDFYQQLTEFFSTEKKTLSAKEIQKPEKINVYKMIIDIEECVDNILSENLSEKDKLSLFRNSICHEIQNRIAAMFTKPNWCTHKSPVISNIVLFSKSELNDEILLNHIIYTFSTFAQENSQLINIHLLGKALSYAEILEFLQAE